MDIANASRGRGRLGALLGAVVFVAVLGAAGAAYWFSSFPRTIAQILEDNRQLRSAVENLSAESQIGYAKVISQETRDGKLFTRLKFVETDRNDPQTRVLEREYEIEGDVVHFDALVVKFDSKFVTDGRERALYLWRRVYGETTAPMHGLPINTVGEEPGRYRELGAKLSLNDRATFWSEVWQLSNDPDRLKDLGITAIDGSVVYKKLQPGLIYSFKVSNTGALTADVTPAL